MPQIDWRALLELVTLAFVIGRTIMGARKTDIQEVRDQLRELNGRVRKTEIDVASAAATASALVLSTAVRAADKTKDKRAFSEGTALMQDLSAQGKDVLLSKVPDSGTAGRLMGSLSNPWALAGLPISTLASLPMSVLYSRSGQNAVNYLVNTGVRPTAEAIRQTVAKNPALFGVAGGRLSELAGQQ